MLKRSASYPPTQKDNDHSGFVKKQILLKYFSLKINKSWAGF